MEVIIVLNEKYIWIFFIFLEYYQEINFNE